MAREQALAALTHFSEEPLYIHRVYSEPAAHANGGAEGGPPPPADGGGMRRSRRSSGGAQITLTLTLPLSLPLTLALPLTRRADHGEGERRDECD